MWSEVARARVPGPLAPFADGFRAELDRLGYTAECAGAQGQPDVAAEPLAGAAGAWGPVTLTTSVAGAFLADFGKTPEQAADAAGAAAADGLAAAGGRGRRAGRRQGRGPADDLLDGYRRWMVVRAGPGRRGRSTGMRRRPGGSWTETGAERPGAGPGVEGLDAAAVTGFLLAEAGRGSVPGVAAGPGGGAAVAAEVFVSGRGDRACPLAAAVPPVPGWKDTAVPRRVSAAQVRALLDSCDQVDGRRASAIFAMLMLLARLGLAGGRSRRAGPRGHRLASRRGRGAGQGPS